MRFDTQAAANYFVWSLLYSEAVAQVTEDGSDIILAELKTGQQVLIYLMERPVTLSEVQETLQANTEAGIHTLLICWCDLLLPAEGGLYTPDPWMAALLSVYSDCIYGFEVAGKQAWFFPVHFEGSGPERMIRYGPPVDFALLHTRSVHSSHPYLPGRWRIAGFGELRRGVGEMPPRPRDPLAHSFELLGLANGADLQAVKRAYRRLARSHHPDLNPGPDAAARMQALNAAYALLLKHLGG